MNKKLILGLGLSVVLASCSSTKSIHGKAIPAGSETAVTIPAKKGEMSEDEIKAWPHADIATDHVPGMSLDKAYKFLEGKTGETVIVAVLDSGIDREHEDLKDVIWVNSDEVAGNGIDDDKNGYVDDIYGWNFLGGKQGESAPEQLEVTRLYKKLTAKFDGKSETDIAEADKKDFELYQKVKKDYEKRISEAKKNFEYYKGLETMILDADKAAKERFGDNYTIDSLKTLPQDQQMPLLMRIMEQGATPADAAKQLKGGIDYYGGQLNASYNLELDGRAKVGDDPYDINDKVYGNGFTIGSKDDESHGTHVTGIIMAGRNNGVGMNGVAQNVKLMSVRTVPDGDEYDKDVALAIRYAVDNGAKVINMSFGKSYSPNPEWVHEAYKYAESKDVLLVHAAGNDGKDLDKGTNFPTDAPDKVNEIVGNVISVGAMTRHYDENLVASFSNYGKHNVDIFAPGLEIYSTFPKDEYKSIQGTSMAAPEVAGVAALIRSYYPQLSANQVKQIIMNSGIKVDLEVKIPKGKGKLVPFSDLSVSGRVLNAYNALKMADAVVNGQ